MPLPPWLRDAIAHPGIRLVRAAVVFVGHGLAVLVVLTVMRAIEAVVALYWGAHDPLIYDMIPLHWLFQTIDVGLIAVLGYQGVVEAIDAYRRPIA